MVLVVNICSNIWTVHPASPLSHSRCARDAPIFGPIRYRSYGGWVARARWRDLRIGAGELLGYETPARPPGFVCLVFVLSYLLLYVCEISSVMQRRVFVHVSQERHLG